MVKLTSIFAVILFSAPLLAQMETFSERGVVKSQGRPVPGATVTAEKGGEKFVTSTGDDGAYELTLPTGEWKITVEMFGFAPSSQTLHPGATAPVTQ